MEEKGEENGTALIEKKEKAGSRRVNVFRLVQTLMLTIPFIQMGTSVTIQYTTIPDLRTRLGISTQQLSYAMSAGASGNLLGGLAAYVVDRYITCFDVIIGACLCAVGGAYALYPFSPNLWCLAVFDFIYSFGCGLYQGAAHSVISHLWGAEGGPARFAIHFGYPLGAFLGPLLAYPFVSVTKSSSDSIMNGDFNDSLFWNITVVTTADAGNLLEVGDSSSPAIEDTSTIEYAYLITSASIFLSALSFFLLRFYLKCSSDRQIPTNTDTDTKAPTCFRDVLAPEKWADGDRWYGVMIVCFSMLVFTLQSAAMKGSQEFLVPYAVDSGMLTNQKAALLNSITFGAGTLARGLAIVAARYITAPYMLLIEVHGQLFFGLLCLFFGTRSKTALWILAPCLGFFRELIWPTGFTWTDYYIILSGIIVGFSNFAFSLINMGLIPLQGYLYDNWSIESIFYTTVGYGLVQCGSLYVMTYFASRKGGRKERAKKRVRAELEALCKESDKEEQVKQTTSQC